MSTPDETAPIGISFPKSGRTWVKAVLRRAGVPLVFTHAGCGSLTRELGRPFAGVVEALAARPVLLLHRNPIDTAVSWFHQVNDRDLAPGTLNRWRRVLRLRLGRRMPPAEIDRFVLHPVYGVEQVCRFNRAWIDRTAGRPDCLVITYEALRADPRAGFARVLGFLGRGEEGLDALVEAASFERMQAREIARAPRSLAFLRPDAREENARKARRGKVGGYVDELRPETVAAARAIAARHGFEA